MNKKAVSQSIEGLQSFRNSEKDPETPKMLQFKRIFEIARSNFVEPKNFFKLIYRLLLNTDRGPRLGNYAVDLGIEKTCEILAKHLDLPKFIIVVTACIVLLTRASMNW